MRRETLPDHLDWLHPSERRIADQLRTERRRQDWLLGRWAARTLLTELLGPETASSLAILPRSDGSPRPEVGGDELNLSLSLSHRGGAALAAVAPSGAVGCDLELVERRSRGFVQDYFDESERRLIAAGTTEERMTLVAALWSAKESVLKLLGKGLTVDTRTLSVAPDSLSLDLDWRSFVARETSSGKVFRGQWRRFEDWVLTVVTYPHPPAPMVVAAGMERG